MVELMQTRGPQIPNNIPTHVMAMMMKTPGKGNGREQFNPMLFAGCDAAIDLLGTPRWDHSIYYNADLNAGLSNCRHSAQLDDTDVFDFDNEFFNLTAEKVVETISPSIRMLLECCFTVLLEGGFTKETMRGENIMTALCDGNNGIVPLTACEVGQHSASRIEHILGLAGPSMTLDTACSTALVAIATAQRAIRASSQDSLNAWYTAMDRPLQHALAGGASFQDNGAAFVGLSQALMIGAVCRSLTFDISADGFMRGESGSVIYLKRDDRYTSHMKDRLVCIPGVKINQDGRSASMTAPSGPSQSACVRGALQQSGATPSEVTMTELHGTGTKLGDPIECGSMKQVQQHRGVSIAPLYHGAGKSIFGHPELNAGCMHICKVIIQHLRSVAISNVHLRQFSPHADLADYSAAFQTELCNIALNSMISGPSSFGFGGTNCRIDLWSRTKLGDNRANRRHVPISEYDNVCVLCPLCNSNMCSRCSVVLQDPAVKHHCAAIRDPSAAYDRCSNCYKGRYKFGAPAQRRKMARRTCVFGTWDAWSMPIEATVTRDGLTVCLVRLGDVNREQFRIVSYVTQGEAGTVYPPVACAGPHSPILGPDGNCQGRHWLIDGIAEGVPVGTVFNIKATHTDLWWEIASPEAARTVPPNQFQHTYHVVGSAVDGEFLQMHRSLKNANIWEAMIRIGSAGIEEFQVVRDGDKAQTVYPAEIPGELSGPDSLSNGRSWLVRGATGENVPVTLCIVDGRMTVTIRGGSSCEEIWQNYNQ